MVDERTRGKLTAGRALAISGCSVFGVGIALPRAFSWDDLGVMVVIWAFFFLLLMAHSGRSEPDPIFQTVSEGEFSKVRL